MKTHLDLCAGIGGFALGLQSQGFKTIAFSEIDPEAITVYEHHFPNVPNLGDMRKIDWHQFRATYGSPYIATAGIPCQPASTLGQMRGSADERWLWPEAIRMVREVRPRYAVFENPPGLLSVEGGRAFNGIVSELAALGYDLWWDVFPAAAFGAGHLRERIILICSDARYATTPAESECKRDQVGREQFNGKSCQSKTPADGEHMGRSRRINGSEGSDGSEDHKTAGISNQEKDAANSNRDGLAESGQCIESVHSETNRIRRDGIAINENVADANGSGLERFAGNGDRENASGGGNQETRGSIATPDLRGRVNCEEWWHETNTGIPVLADGIPNKLVEAACRCFGNAIIPQVPYLIGKVLNEIEEG